KNSATKSPLRGLRGYIPVYCGPPPPSGGTQVITPYGSMMSHVLQCTQFDALICRRGVPSASLTISYTLAGQNRVHGWPYSGPQIVLHTSVCTSRCEGWSSSCAVP